MNFRSVVLTSIVLSFIGSALAQGGSASVGEGTVIYKKEITGGLIIHSDGWGLNLRLGQAMTAKTRRVFEFSAVTMKHPKEFKSFNPYYEDSKGYIFGKQNSFFVIRPSYGHRRVLFDKMRNRAVEVGFSWSIGPSVGFAKPIYLEIGHPAVPYEYITVEKYNSDEHFVDNIFGKAPSTKGLDEIKVYAGLHSRFGMHFEYANDKDAIKALEAGVALDAYPQEVPIMAELNEVSNKQFFVTFYVNLLYGKKYFR